VGNEPVARKYAHFEAIPSSVLEVVSAKEEHRAKRTKDNPTVPGLEPGRVQPRPEVPAKSFNSFKRR